MKNTIEVEQSEECDDNNNICGKRCEQDENLLKTGSLLENVHKEFYMMASIVGVQLDSLNCTFTKVYPFLDWIENLVWSNEE